MNILKRDLEKVVSNYLIPNKVLVITGARRVGKSVLLKNILNSVNEPFMLLNGESIDTIEQLNRRSVDNYKNLLQNNKLLIIDEAQKIPDIGIKLKLMIDEIDNLKIIVTGSSAFDIQNTLGEPLTGRKYDFILFAFSEKELLQINNTFQLKASLNHRIIFGNYPELIHLQTKEQKINYLKNLISSYLLKDILAYDNLRSSETIYSLLKLLAFQVGSEVSYNELSNKLSISKNTVEKYIDLLRKVCVLYKIDSFGNNKRKELTRSKKIYFYDNGIRNAVISNFNSIDMRDDVGKLWENYIISERLKYLSLNNIFSTMYFWRTFDRQEIDLVEENSGVITAYEIKWKEKRFKIPAYWRYAYPTSNVYQINSDNYYNFIGIGNEES